MVMNSRRLLSLLAAMALVVPQAVLAQDAPALSLELNKLEPVAAANGAAPGCQVYMVAKDPEGGPKFDALRLDLALFGTDGVIAQRLALDVGPITPGRTQVRQFQLRDLPCDGLGQILVNDALICKVGGADQTDCLDRVKTSSRVTAKLVR